MDPIAFLILGVVIGLVGFHLGRLVTSRPTEREMFERLVQLRVERRREKAVREQLESEINNNVTAAKARER